MQYILYILGGVAFFSGIYWFAGFGTEFGGPSLVSWVSLVSGIISSITLFAIGMIYEKVDKISADSSKAIGLLYLLEKNKEKRGGGDVL
jgi:hypothetical protein